MAEPGRTRLIGPPRSPWQWAACADHRPTATRVGVKARERADAGIADEDIEPAVAFTSQCHERRGIGTPCHVCGGKTRFPVRARDAVGQRFEPIEAAPNIAERPFQGSADWCDIGWISRWLRRRPSMKGRM